MNEDLIELIRVAAHDHLFHVMRNKRYYMGDWYLNFSTTQYMNERVHKNGFKTCENIVNKLKSIDPNGSYLNMGTAAGHLPWANNVLEAGLRIDNVEWDDQLICCETLRKSFDININYTCNNVNDDDFEIRGCEETYDYVVLQRFFPIYHTLNAEAMRNVLRKFKPYARKSVIVEADQNWSEGVFEDLLSFSERRVDLGRGWSLIVTDIGKA